MSAEAFRRPRCCSAPLVLNRRTDDPLGYDISDIRRAAHRMAEDALSGRNAAAVDAELAKVRARLGLAEHEGAPRARA
jgi:hypothetical protein